MVRSARGSRFGARGLVVGLLALSMVAGGPLAGAARAVGGGSSLASAMKPAIRWKRIPFGHRRLRQTAGYSKRHYGQHTWRLRGPSVIVEHYTDGPSFASAYNTFASDSPHMGERPGVCAHFVIDTDGTIYQLVDVGVRCRHTIGLNYTAIGIEHVGTSDRQILHNRRMMRSSLQLTVWLMARYGIQLRDVIGHAESLMSPYHQERYSSWRCLTHSDWLHHDMQVYRRRLKSLAKDRGVPIGPRPDWVKPRC
jgi:beta-N-acetylhexosaminidase